MKKISTLFLSFCLIATFTMSTFAGTNRPIPTSSNNNSINLKGYEKHADKVSNDINNLKKAGITASRLSPPINLKRMVTLFMM